MLDGKRAYICSPLSATTKEVRQQNMEKAKFYLMQIKRLYHCRTFASHAHLPLMDYENAVMWCISQLRKILRNNPKRMPYIETVWGMGYKFNSGI